jgi:rhamnosyltransferase
MHSSLNDTQNVCAVIVTYNPDIKLYRSLSTLENQVGKIIIVDNNSRQKFYNKTEFNNKYSSKIDIILNTKNKGLAFAQNQGIKQALSLDYQWVVMLDDDSIFSEGAIEKMLSAYEKYYQELKIGIVAPKHVYNEKLYNINPYSNKGNILLIKKKLLISSGSLINTDIFKKLGFYKSSFFIDYIDTEFCLRLRQNGYNLYTLPNIFLYHWLGKVYTKRIFNYTFNYTMSESSVRWYYKFRNRIRTYLLYGKIFPRWVLEDIYLVFKELIKIVILGPNRILCCKYVLKGIVDGMNGASGVIRK